MDSANHGEISSMSNDGAAIGVVTSFVEQDEGDEEATSSKRFGIGGPEPVLALNLPGWLLYQLRIAKTNN